MTAQNIDQVKHAIDAASIVVVSAAWVNWLPDVGALFTIIWVTVRIWETETVRRITRRACKPRNDDI